MNFIQRYQPTTDESPPWAGISFKYPVDSDSLAEQLKRAYPNCRTLRERKHQAAIDFLHEELERMRMKDPTSPTILTSTDRPLAERRQDESKTYIEISSDRSRPQSASGYTSSLSGSVHSPGMADRARLSASTGANPGPPRPTNPTTNPQQIVWNSHNGKSMQPKTKRKMTLEERKAYKKTREQGACDACRKQKARCTHAINGETLPTQPTKPAKRYVRLFLHAQSLVHGSRRKSTGLDIAQPEEHKLIKTEHPSDIHQVEQRQPRRASVPTSHDRHSCMNEPAEPVSEPMLRNKQLEDELGYVNTEPTMDFFDVNLSQDHGPWSPYTPRNPVDHMNPGFTQGPSMTTETFPPAMANPPAGDFSFQAEYFLPWNDGQDQQLGNAGSI